MSKSTNESLLDAMAERGVGKRALARVAQISYRTVMRMCAKNRVGSVDTWMRVADALDASLDEITGRSYGGQGFQLGEGERGDNCDS